MSTIKKELRKNTLMQILAGVILWFVIQPKKLRSPVINVGPLEPVGVEYQPIYFRDSEYFGKNIPPADYYSNWVKLARELDKIRVAYGLPVLIKKGYNISEPDFAACKAVEIAPQNNDIERFKSVVTVVRSSLEVVILEYLPKTVLIKI